MNADEYEKQQQEQQQWAEQIKSNQDFIDRAKRADKEFNQVIEDRNER